MKREFYIYQEELVGFKLSDDTLTLSEYVKILNDTFCEPDMKKMRVEKVISYLIAHRFLKRNDRNMLVPTIKGKLFGIFQEERVCRSGDRYIVNIYPNCVLKYLTDNIYSII